MLYKYIIGIVFGYFCGSIPFGLLIGKFHGIDVRKMGSGNIGATNVTRALGIRYGIAVALLDGIKGFACAMILGENDINLRACILCFSVLGHMYSIFLKFQGGKGVSTFFIGIFALHIVLGITFVVSWICVFGRSKISSLASLSAIFVTMLMAWVLFALRELNFISIEYILGTTALIFYKHKANIKRLIYGTEQSFEKP